MPLPVYMVIENNIFFTTMDYIHLLSKLNHIPQTRFHPKHYFFIPSMPDHAASSDFILGVGHPPAYWTHDARRDAVPTFNKINSRHINISMMASFDFSAEENDKLMQFKDHIMGNNPLVHFRLRGILKIKEDRLTKIVPESVEIRWGDVTLGRIPLCNK